MELINKTIHRCVFLKGVVGISDIPHGLLNRKI